MSADGWGGAADHLRALGGALARAPDEAGRAATALQIAWADGALVRAVTYGLILLTAGVGLEWLYWSYAAPPLRAALALHPSSPRGAVVRAGRILLLRAGGIAGFAGATAGAASVLPWPGDAGSAALAAALIAAAARAGGLLAGCLAALPRPEAHPIGARRSAPPALLAGAAAGFAAAAWLLPGAVANVLDAPSLAEALRIALAAPVALAALLAAAARGRSRDAAGRPRLPPIVPTVAVVGACAGLWLAGQGLWAVLILDGGAVVALLAASRGALAPLLWEGAPADGWAALLPSLALATVRFGVVILGLAVLALAAAAADPDGWAATTVARTLPRAVGVAALTLAASLLWLALSTGVGVRLGRIDRAGEAAHAGPDGRLLTLLPLLRTTGGVALLVGFALSALWALDVPIAPLLAGAGIFGLAIGFGAQALVRDIISGVFYLAEDVFRVGEYIEGTANAKGTVERITLRTVALRHPSGPLHFVPYGTLGSVRNGSRDWVLDKFDLPLPVGVDSERVRKLIKRVGRDMMEDEAYAGLIQAPLKAKLSRIEPGVKVFRCKFPTLPGRQFDIRAGAYRRIEAALGEAGIAFADTAQTTVVLRRPAGPTG